MRFLVLEHVPSERLALILVVRGLQDHGCAAPSALDDFGLDFVVAYQRRLCVFRRWGCGVLRGAQSGCLLLDFADPLLNVCRNEVASGGRVDAEAHSGFEGKDTGPLIDRLWTCWFEDGWTGKERLSRAGRFFSPCLAGTTEKGIPNQY